MTNKDAQGNTTMDFPITKVENVEGFEKAVDTQRPLKTYTSLEQLGLTNEATPQQVGDALARGTMLSMEVSTNKTPNLVPTLASAGMLMVTCDNSVGNHKAFYYNDATYGQYIGNYSAYMPDNFKWTRLAEKEKLSMPSSQYINIDVTQGLRYICPADGWLWVTAIPQSTETITGIYQVDGAAYYIKVASVSQEGGNYKTFCIPYRKGTTIVFDFVRIVTADGYRFYYAQSEV